MEVTVTIKGDLDSLSRVLTLLQNESGPTEPTPGGTDLDQFTKNLTTLGRKMVGLIARPSSSLKAATRASLMRDLGLSAQEIAGVSGGIGIHWARCSNVANPFIGKWNVHEQDVEYQVEDDLADNLLARLKES